MSVDKIIDRIDTTMDNLIESAIEASRIEERAKMRLAISRITAQCHQQSMEAGWYNNPDTGEALVRNIPEMLCLIHSEISEAMEGLRKDLMDDKLPHRSMVEVELADAVIRIMDLCGYQGYDLAGAIIEKLEYNKNRADHKMENRAKEGGKKF